MVNWIFYLAIVLIAIIGFFQGFHRCLNFYFKGFFGHVISIFLCFALGGIIKNIPMVSGWVTSLDNILTNAAQFLSGWAATCIYYVALFIIISTIKLIFTKLLVSLFGNKNIVIKIINKVLGACFAVAMTFLLMWLFISILGMFKNGEIVNNLYEYLASKGGNILIDILKWNPMQGLFGVAA